VNRRHFLRLSAAGFAGVSLAACVQPIIPSSEIAPEPTSMPAPPTASAAAITPVPYPAAEPTTLIEPGTTLRNEDTARFFVRYYKALPAPDRNQWRLAIGGLVEAPATLSLTDIRRTLPYHEQNTRMACVEGWSSRATWGGFIYNDLVTLVRAKPAATHVRFDCMDEYWESVAITELQRAGALFTTHMNGTYLPAKHGAPLRMILPWLYGYKGAKVISRLTFSDKEERGFWPTRGPFTTAGDIEAGRDFPLDLGPGEARSITGGEVTQY
jgi:methionine sulfoxide reductase catalytic subunit